jgi:hypothetical protein
MNKCVFFDLCRKVITINSLYIYLILFLSLLFTFSELPSISLFHNYFELEISRTQNETQTQK